MRLKIEIAVLLIGLTALTANAQTPTPARVYLPNVRGGAGIPAVAPTNTPAPTPTANPNLTHNYTVSFFDMIRQDSRAWLGLTPWDDTYRKPGSAATANCAVIYFHRGLRHADSVLWRLVWTSKYATDGARLVAQTGGYLQTEVLAEFGGNALGTPVNQGAFIVARFNLLVERGEEMNLCTEIKGTADVSPQIMSSRLEVVW